MAQLEDLFLFTLLFVAQYRSHQTGPQKNSKDLVRRSTKEGILLCHVLSKVLMWCHWSRSKMKEFCFNHCPRVRNSLDHLDEPSCCGCPGTSSHLTASSLDYSPLWSWLQSFKMFCGSMASLNWLNFSVDGQLHTEDNFLFGARFCKFRLMYSPVSGGSSCTASNSFQHAEHSQEKKIYRTIH